MVVVAAESEARLSPAAESEARLSPAKDAAQGAGNAIPDIRVDSVNSSASDSSEK